MTRTSGLKAAALLLPAGIVGLVGLIPIFAAVDSLSSSGPDQPGVLPMLGMMVMGLGFVGLAASLAWPIASVIIDPGEISLSASGLSIIYPGCSGQ